MANITPVILAGGVGARLWPASREAFPKQFSQFGYSKHTMLQETWLRVAGLPGIQPPIVICNEQYRFIVADQLQRIQVPNPTIVLEPVAKNTAPAITIASLIANEADTLLILPADHQILHHELFMTEIQRARGAITKDALLMFGVKPSRPETGYGYIKKGAQAGKSAVYHVEQFTEKPDINTANTYCDSGDYYWNSGMFMFSAGAFLTDMAVFEPAILQSCQKALDQAVVDVDFLRLNKAAFLSCPMISVDYAVMEKTDQINMLPVGDIGWSDLGSWESVYQTSEKDESGNVLLGNVIAEDVTNSYIHSDARLVAALGVQDHIIVETRDAVLVAHKNHTQEVKKIVQRLVDQQQCEAVNHLRVYRPWGYYDNIDSAPHFNVKRITINPGASISLQAHQYRSEHWVVISGCADVACNERAFMLQPNESTYIPPKARHRLTNAGDEPLVIVEVQTGDYIGEDDIIRYEDNYGREVADASSFEYR